MPLTRLIEAVARLAYRMGRKDQQRMLEHALRQRFGDGALASLLHEAAVSLPDDPVDFESIIRAAQAADKINDRRAPVQGTRDLGKPAGTIAWDEHVEAWNAYAEKYGRGQSAERIAERAGFDYAELVEFLEREPETWRAR